MRQTRRRRPINQWQTTIARFFQQPDVVFLTWIALELSGVAVAISLLEYLAGWHAPAIDGAHPFLKILLINWANIAGHFPTPGFGAIAIFLVLTYAQPRFWPWPRWHVPYLIASGASAGALLLLAVPSFRLIILIGAYGTLAHARVAFGRRGGRQVGLALILGVLPVLALTHAATVLQGGIWLLGALFVETFIGLGMQERAARQQAEMLVADLHVAQHQLRVYAARAEELATMRERSRVAREIHDTLAQGLVATVMQIETGDAIFDTEPAIARHHFQRALDLAGATLRETRTSILEMHSDTPMSHSLLSSLQTLAVTWQKTGVSVVVRADMDDEHVTAVMTLACYRITQEAIANAVRHGHARMIVVEISHDADRLFLTVTDDGVGFDPRQSPVLSDEGGFGLVSMRERAHLLQGHLEVISTPGMGAQVVATLPLKSVSQEHYHGSHPNRAGR